MRIYKFISMVLCCSILSGLFTNVTPSLAHKTAQPLATSITVSPSLTPNYGNEFHTWDAETTSWIDAACGDYIRHPEINEIAVPICHTGRFALMGRPSTTPLTWRTDFIDDAKGAFQEVEERALQVDGAGHPHMVYGGHHLYYAWYDGTTWHKEIVDATPGVGGSAALMLEATAPYTAHIVYEDADGRLKYAVRNATQWQIESLDIGRYFSIALDQDDHLHIAYGSQDDIWLWHLYWTGATWEREVVDSDAVLVTTLRPTGGGGGVGSPIPVMKVDDVDGIHIAYLVNASNNTISLKYAHRAISGDWNFSYVDHNIYFPDDVSLALGPQNVPQLAYSGYFGIYPNGDDAIRYAAWNGSAWVTQTVTNTDRSKYLSLAVDTSGQPYIAYHVNAGITLRLATFSSETWAFQDVGNGNSLSLALDDTDAPHIGCYNRNNRAIQYLYHTGSTWQAETLDSESYVGEYASMDLDASDRPHWSYYFYDRGTFHGELRYATPSGNGWITQTVPGVYGYDTSLQLDSTGHPHIASYGNYNILYSVWNGSSWDSKVVDNGLGYGGQPRLVLDTIEQPHLAYYSASGTGELRYATWNGSAWVTTTIDTGLRNLSWDWEMRDRSLSLVLDGTGKPQITYYSYPQHALRYAVWDGSQWITTTVDATGNEVGRYSSLALDNAGHAHIAYYEKYSLRYAYRDGSGTWVTQTIGYRGQGPVSLALNANGDPCIAYGGWRLIYACHSGGEWQITELGTGGDYSTLRFDALGYPHIGHYGNGVLRYTHLAEAPRITYVYLPLVVRNYGASGNR